MSVVNRVKVWMNSCFQDMPHPWFYENCVKEHLKRNHPHMPFAQQQAWKKVYLSKLIKGEMVKINGQTFKLPQ